MSILSTLKNLVFPHAALICPHCERTLDEHDDGACQRAMSRRYFFQMGVGAVAAVAAFPGTLKALESFGGGPLQNFVVTGVEQSGIALARRSEFLTVEKITHEMLRILKMNTDVMGVSNAGWGSKFTDAEQLKIGDTVTFAGVYQVNPHTREIDTP